MGFLGNEDARQILDNSENEFNFTENQRARLYIVTKYFMKYTNSEMLNNHNIISK